MSALAGVAFWGGVVLCVPTGFLLLEVLAGLFLRVKPFSRADAPKTVVLIPAHNEEAQISIALRGLLEPRDGDCRVIVIADNCSDLTAQVARQAGAEALERTDPERAGKPQALVWALQQIEAEPPEVVVFLDADCWFEQGSPRDLAALAVAHGRPVQCVYRTKGPGLRDFAFRFRSEIRMRGLAALGAPVQICGSGFAVPWPLLKLVPPPQGELAEDAVWGWKYAMAGQGCLFVPEVLVLSTLPSSAAGVSVQQNRWEYGTLSATRRYLPKLLRSAFLPPRLSRILHILDVLVPPLALLVLTSMALVSLGALTGGLRASLPSLIALSLLAVAVFTAWMRYARKDLALSTLLYAPFYALKKIKLYGSFLGRRDNTWTKTDRG